MLPTDILGMLFQELRQASRTLRRQPTYAAVVILTLALGIGANTAIFSVFSAVQLRELPFEDEERLVYLSETVQREELETRPFSWPDFLDVQSSTTTLQAVAAVTDDELVLEGETDGEASVLIIGEWVSPGFFDLLGVRPVYGEAFSGVDPSSLGRSVILGHGLWLSRYGGDPQILGTTLRLDGDPYDVVGVLPQGFLGATDASEFFLPLVESEPDEFGGRGSRYFDVLGRLAPGTTAESARAELGSIFARLEEDFPDSNRGYGATATPLREELLGDLATPLRLLLVAVGLVLLIACANLANLCLVRAADRRRELAVRRALGAGQGRLIFHFQAEILLLALLGGGLGLLLSLWGLEVLAAMAPLEIPSFAELRLDLPVLAFTLGLCVATAMFLGLITAWGAAGSDPAQALEQGSRGATGGRSRKRFRSMLVVAEVALALTLLVAAGLTLQSLRWLSHRELGFSAEDLALFRYRIPAEEGQEAPTEAFAQGVLERLRALPGVEAASVSSDLPFGSRSAVVLSTPEMAFDPDAPYGGGTRIYLHRVSPGFFSTLGTPLLEGRDFEPGDEKPGTFGVIVSRSLGEKLWPGKSPVGRLVKPGTPSAPGQNTEEDEWFTVVAVAEDMRYRSLVDTPGEPADPDLFIPMRAARYAGGTVALRTTMPPPTAMELARRALAEMNPRTVVYEPAAMTERLAEVTAQSRFNALLLALFGTTALALASVGIYGVMAYAVGRRRREMGIRLALGARAGKLVAGLVGQGLVLAMVGAVLGLVGAFAAGRLLSDQLSGVTATDPKVLALGTLLLLAVAAVACYLPARRASRIEPVEVLRDE